MFYQCPWMGVQILEHGDPLPALVDQAALAVDFHDLTCSRGGDARSMDRVLPVEADDVAQARALLDAHPALAARDLLHLAVCRRHGITELKTFDRGLNAAFARRRRS